VAKTPPASVGLALLLALAACGMGCAQQTEPSGAGAQHPADNAPVRAPSGPPVETAPLQQQQAASEAQVRFMSAYANVFNDAGDQVTYLWKTVHAGIQDPSLLSPPNRAEWQMGEESDYEVISGSMNVILANDPDGRSPSVVSNGRAVQQRVETAETSFRKYLDDYDNGRQTAADLAEIDTGIRAIAAAVDRMADDANREVNGAYWRHVPTP
jgi:hypothetical protein